jgi:hypothetical protein
MVVAANPLAAGAAGFGLATAFGRPATPSAAADTRPIRKARMELV